MTVKQNKIGLDKSETAGLATQLNELLSNYQLFYVNTRGFHWNIKGDNFFELHVKFEELYNDLQLKNDEIAERILTIGGIPLHSFTDYIKKSTIKEITGVSNGKEAVKHILDAFGTIIKLQREILEASEEAGDEGTNALMSDYVRSQEKLVWMYNAYLGK